MEFVNFLHNRNILRNPIITGNNVIKQVICYKILGFILSNDLKWNSHVDYIVEKSCKKLYSLRVLRRAGVSKSKHSESISYYDKTSLRIRCARVAIYPTLLS